MRKIVEQMYLTAGMTISGHPLLKIPGFNSAAICRRTSAEANAFDLRVGWSRVSAVSEYRA